MLSDYMELFEWQRPDPAADSAGGHCPCPAPLGLVRAAIASSEGREVLSGGLFASHCATVLLHGPEVTLRQGDRMRRLRDGAQWRVLSRSEDMSSPPRAAQRFCQVRVERVVSA